MPESADGKGRTLWDILSGRNQRDMTPLELQYHNPLEAKIGCTISFDHEPEISGINFVIEKISVYETQVGPQKFYHTDYWIKGTSLEIDGYVRLRLRVIPDEKLVNELGCRVQLLYIYDEMGWDEGLYDLCCNNGDHDPDVDAPGEFTFKVNYDDEGNELEVARRYWRVEDVPDPYKATMTLLSDLDGDGKIDDDELEHREVEYWDFHRDTVDLNEQPMVEFLSIDMDCETRYFTFVRGTDVLPSQIVIV